MEKLIFVFLLLLSLNEYAFSAPCTGIGLSSSATNITLLEGVPQQLPLSVSRPTNAEACPFFITFSYGNWVTGSTQRRLAIWGWGNFVPYGLYKNGVNSSPLLDFSQLNSSLNAVTGSFLQNTSGTQNFTYTAALGIVPTDIWTAPWTYSDTITIKLYQGTPENPLAQLDSISVQFRYYPDTILYLSLVNTGGGFDQYSLSKTVDFGEMSSAQSQSLDAIVRSNSGYNLFMTSTNGGKLQHNSQNFSVPYTTTVAGQVKSLGANTKVSVKSEIGNTGSAGVRIPIQFTLGTITNQPPGTYSDTITVTVESN